MRAAGLVAVCVALACTACGGIRVQGTTWAGDDGGTFTLDVASAVLTPRQDQLVTTCRECDLEKVDELDYLVAGADDEGRTWQAWLRFDLTDLGIAAEVGRATLVLPTVAGPTLPGASEGVLFEVRPVADPWSGDTLGHQRAPRLSTRTVATTRRTPGSTNDPVRLDVAEAIVVALDAGRADVTLAIAGADANEAFRWRIASSESGSPTDEAATPRLIIEFGESPPPPPAAVR